MGCMSTEFVATGSGKFLVHYFYSSDYWRRLYLNFVTPSVPEGFGYPYIPGIKCINAMIGHSVLRYGKS